MIDASRADLELDVVARLRAGDERAFERLFARYYRELCVYAMRIDRSGAAEDIVQDVFFRIWMHREQLQDVSSLSAYLYTVTRNLALNRVARGHTEDKWRASGQALLLSGESVGDTDLAVRETEMALAIDMAIGQLPPRCREAFLLRRREHLSHAQIAERMQTTTKTVEVQIGKALRMLRTLLAEWL
jgi:RNA polymerase sigma-70 factor (ECF subfamily)